MESLADELRQLLASFTEGVTKAVQRAALAAMAEALETPKPAGRERATRSSRASRLDRRGPEALGIVKSRLLAAIGSKRGMNFEEIRRRLKLERRELVLPLRKLVAEHAVKTTGVKRAMRYFPSKHLTTRVTKRARGRNR